MSDRFVVEVRKRTVGIAVRTRGGFGFFASEPAYFALEGRLFPDLRAVTAAAEDLGLPSGGPRHAPASDAGEPKRASAEGERALPSHSRAGQPPEWFRWAVIFGVAGSSALAGAVFSGAAH